MNGIFFRSVKNLLSRLVLCSQGSHEFTIVPTTRKSHLFVGRRSTGVWCRRRGYSWWSTWCIWGARAQSFVFNVIVIVNVVVVREIGSHCWIGYDTPVYSTFNQPGSNSIDALGYSWFAWKKRINSDSEKKIEYCHMGRKTSVDSFLLCPKTI